MDWGAEKNCNSENAPVFNATKTAKICVEITRYILCPKRQLKGDRNTLEE